MKLSSLVASGAVETTTCGDDSFFKVSFSEAIDMEPNKGAKKKW